MNRTRPAPYHLAKKAEMCLLWGLNPRSRVFETLGRVGGDSSQTLPTQCARNEDCKEQGTRSRASPSETMPTFCEGESSQVSRDGDGASPDRFRPQPRSRQRPHTMLAESPVSCTVQAPPMHPGLAPLPAPRMELSCSDLSPCMSGHLNARRGVRARLWRAGPTKKGQAKEEGAIRKRLQKRGRGRQKGRKRTGEKTRVKKERERRRGRGNGRRKEKKTCKKEKK